MNPAAPNPEVQALLQQLHDIETLQTVSWWPPAPGWWLLAIALVGSLTWLIYTAVNRHRSNRYKRAARLEIQKLHDTTEGSAMLLQANYLLKRVAISAYPQWARQIKQLHGQEWAVWLQKVCPRAPMSNQVQNGLAAGLYQPNCIVDKSELTSFVEFWVGHHPRKLPNYAQLTEAVETNAHHGAQHV